MINYYDMKKIFYSIWMTSLLLLFTQCMDVINLNPKQEQLLLEDVNDDIRQEFYGNKRSSCFEFYIDGRLLPTTTNKGLLHIKSSSQGKLTFKIWDAIKDSHDNSIPFELILKRGHREIFHKHFQNHENLQNFDIGEILSKSQPGDKMIVDIPDFKHKITYSVVDV